VSAPPTFLTEALHDRYLLERELGRGGMATVYLARDVKHDRSVAIKVLQSELSAALGPERFHREILLAGKLQHPNILSLYDSGEAEGTLYYVMPYVEGQSLRDRLEREGQLPLGDALGIGREVAAALEYAHGHDVLHRDIKPENILLSGGHALVADFGIARAITVAGGVRLTGTGIAVGTPAYMSPEQATAATRVDGRSDVYSLGCVLYEMVAGEPPFTGPSAQAVVARKLIDPVPSLRTVRESVPEALERVILKALARIAADRFATAGQFADALEEANAEVLAPRGASGRTVLARPAWLRVMGRRGTVLALGASAALLALGAWLWVRQSKVHWARTVALPQAVRLVQQGKTFAAYRLLRQAQTQIPDDPLLKELWLESTIPIAVQTEPKGAQVYVRDFFDRPSASELLGSAPLDGVRLPFGNLVWKIVLPGFQTQEVLGFTPRRTLEFSLPPAAAAPVDMVHIPAGRFELFSTRAVDLSDYWIDKYEVTNRQFKEFVDGGGYEKRDHWTEPFVTDGVTLSWGQTRQLFRDRTGRASPATWELGTYPDGQDDYPVAGVSWYEAAAYCASVGKQLPTIYHWYRAADLGGVTDFAQYGNFSAAGPAKVGQPLRLGVNGTYDMAGNVKEWTWNQADRRRRYILGAGWNEPSYYFSDYDAQRPFDRQPTYGFRCAKYTAAVPAALMSAVAAPSRDYRRETPVSGSTFALYRSLYRYDRTPLAATVDSVDDRLEHWRVEHVSFNAAYANERVPALLFLPKGGRPPYQTVVFFPGAGAFRQQSRVGAADLDEYWFLFLVRSGRAVVFPIYKGTYERHIGLLELPQVWRDLMIYASKDLGRTIDYLETRADIDTSRLAYFGISLGAGVGPIMTAVESRFKASVLLGGGLYAWRRPPEAEAFNFLPRVNVPTLMINGRHDFYFPLETSQARMFRMLGTAPADKRHRVFESGHVPTERQEVMKEILDWLDRYLER
jgi:eukaryotic-like serine/threonine-protein kinase